MGNLIPKKVFNPYENDDSKKEKLTTEEQVKMNNLNPIFENFYKDPTLTNYQAIREYDDLFYKAVGNIYTLYIHMIKYLHPEFGDQVSYREKQILHLQVNDLLDPKRVLTAKDLDKLWALYYASGNNNYPDRVKNVINDGKQDMVVRWAAEWSYNSHQQMNKI